MEFEALAAGVWETTSVAAETTAAVTSASSLAVGTHVQVVMSSRSAALRGMVGVVISVGRQVEVQFDSLADDPKGPVRRLNRTDLVEAGDEAAAPTGASSLAALAGVELAPRQPALAHLICALCIMNRVVCGRF